MRLYEKSGFVRWRRPVGYEASGLDPVPADVEKTGIAEYAAGVARHGELGLPRQLMAATVGAATLPVTAFRGGAGVALLVAATEVLTLRGIVVDSAHRRQGHARRLLRGLAARFPGRRWVVPAIVPETLADEWFLSNGFQHAAISQFEMARGLHGG